MALRSSLAIGGANVVEPVDESALRVGFAELDSLSALEYHESLAAVVADTDANRSAVRVGRLVGVVLKEPFAESHNHTEASARTQAYRSWDLVSEAKFKTEATTWQYLALEEIRKELIPDEPWLDTWTPYRFAMDAYNEKGFFGRFGRAVRKYICGDPEIRRKVEHALKDSAIAADNEPFVTPEKIVGGGGLALRVYLVQAVPIMGMVGAPIVAGVVVILYRLGLESFCDWSEGLRTDEDEKH